jgi:hypothetical protein
MTHRPYFLTRFSFAGEVNLHLFRFYDAINAFAKAESLGDTEVLPRYLKALSWTSDFKDFEMIAAKVEYEGNKCIANLHNLSICKLDRYAV